MEPSSAPAVLNPKKQLRDNLQSENFKLAIKEIQSKYITPDRMVRIALSAINRIPELAECTQPSFFSALMRLTEIGLEPDGYHAHLIPFNKKVKNPKPGQPQYIKEVQLIVDYKGLVTVIRRNPAIAVVKGAVVYEHDKFTYREGSDRYFEHEPAWVEGDAIRGAYSFVKFANINDWELSYVPVWEIEGIRKRSRAGNSGPWVTDYAQMCIKTALRRHAKMLPLTAEEQHATLIDDDTIETEEQKLLPQRTAKFKPLSRASLPEDGNDPMSEDATAGRSEHSHFGETGNGEPAQDPSDGPEPQESGPIAEQEEEKTRKEQERLRAEFNKAFDKLRKLMDENRVTDAELLFVLNDFSVPAGEAEQTGSVSDLPYDTVKTMPKQWPTYLFSINAKRKLAAGEIAK